MSEGATANKGPLGMVIGMGFTIGIRSISPSRGSQRWTRNCIKGGARGFGGLSSLSMV